MKKLREGVPLSVPVSTIYSEIFQQTCVFSSAYNLSLKLNFGHYRSGMISALCVDQIELLEEITGSLVEIIEAVRTSETSFTFETAQSNRTRRRENLKAR
jgi:hypothetical protein